MLRWRQLRRKTCKRRQCPWTRHSAPSAETERTRTRREPFQPRGALRLSGEVDLLLLRYLRRRRAGERRLHVAVNMEHGGGRAVPVLALLGPDADQRDLRIVGSLREPGLHALGPLVLDRCLVADDLGAAGDGYVVLLGGIGVAEVDLLVLGDLRHLGGGELGEEPEVAVLVRFLVVHRPRVELAVR